MLLNILLLLCLYLPFQIALNPTDGIDLATVRIFILAVFFIWLARGLKNKKIIIRDNLLTGLILAFLFLNLLSVFYAPNVNWAVRKILFLFSIFPLYFVISDLNSGKLAEKVAKMLVISGLVLAGIGIVQFLAQFIFGLNQIYDFWARHVAAPFLGANAAQAVLAYPSWLVNVSGQTYMRSISVFPDPHMFSMYLGLLLPLAIGFWLKSRRTYALASVFFIFLADILSFSRGGYLGLIGGGLFIAFFSLPRLGKRFKVWFAGAIMILFLIIIIPNPINDRFLSSFNLSEGSNRGRLEMWKAAEKMILDHPFSGVGIGNFSYAVKPMANYREPIYAHNTYLDIAAEAGFLAGMIWLGIIVIAIARNLNQNRGGIYIGLAVSLVIFGIHSFVDTGLYSPTVLTLLVILLGLSFPYKTDEKAD